MMELVLDERLDDQFEKLRKENEQFYMRIRTIAHRNNLGISLEKDGMTDEAIEQYELNIKDGYPATHSFNRLMVIYRRTKCYEDEIRVIKRAIDVFSCENRRRANNAISRHPDKEDSIRMSEQSCTQIYEEKEGRITVLFNPYPVTNYRQRLDKAQKLYQKEMGKCTLEHK